MLNIVTSFKKYYYLKRWDFYKLSPVANSSGQAKGSHAVIVSRGVVLISSLCMGPAVRRSYYAPEGQT